MSNLSNLLKLGAGVIATMVVLLMAFVVPGGGTLHTRTIIIPEQIFRVTSDAPGQYAWTLLNGRSPAGLTTVDERVMTAQRGDLMVLRLNNALTSGDLINEGQVLAQLTSTQTQRDLVELVGEIQALEARRLLLSSGARIEEVAAAQQRVQLATARREQTAVTLQRLQLLQAQGAAPEAEVQDALLADQVARLEVDLARAELAVSQSSARPEAIAELDASLEGMRAQITELQRINEEDIACPISGVLELGGSRLIVVKSVDVVYARFPIPERRRPDVQTGDPVMIEIPGMPGEFEGFVESIGVTSDNINGKQAVWASARIENPDHVLLPRSVGTVSLPAKRVGLGFFSDIYDALVEPQ